MFSSWSIIADVTSVYSFSMVARRADFGWRSAPSVSCCMAASFVIADSKAGSSVVRSGNSIVLRISDAALSAGISASRDFWISGLSGLITASVRSARPLIEQSSRKLCSAVNMCAEALAADAMRSTAPSRVHELQAPNASAITSAPANRPMTDFNRTLTDRRFMNVPPKPAAKSRLDCVLCLAFAAASRGAYRGDEFLDLVLERAAFARERLRRAQDLRGCRAGFARAAVDVGDVGRDLRRAV